MPLDVNDLVAFYSSPLGDVSRRLIGRVLRARWDNCARAVDARARLSAGPISSAFATRRERALAFMPAEQGVVNWPASGRSASALVAPDMLPLPDASIDRALVVHALETAEHPERGARGGVAGAGAGRARDRRRAVAARRLGARRRHAVRPGPALFEGAIARADARRAVLADLSGARRSTRRRSGAASSSIRRRRSSASARRSACPSPACRSSRRRSRSIGRSACAASRAAKSSRSQPGARPRARIASGRGDF